MDDFEFEIEDDAVTITKYKGNSKNVDIPAEIQGKPVKEVEGDVNKQSNIRENR